MTNGKIKILFTGLHDADHVGGIETYIRKILHSIDRSKFQIDFLVFKGSIPCFFDELKNLGCCFHFVTSRKQNLLKNIFEIKKLFSSEKFDIIHCHLNSLSYITPCVIACKKKIPVIVHSRNAGCLQGKISRVLHRINFVRMKRLPVFRVAVSDLAGKWMFGKSDYLVLNNGLDVSKYRYSIDKRIKKRRELGLGEEKVFINVGAFRNQKNQMFAVKVFQEFIKIKEKTKLIFVGHGYLKEKVENYVKKEGLDTKVIFLGGRSDVPELLCAADVFVFPSWYEGFPNALLEAETNGLRCVVSDVITKQAIFPELCEALPLNLGFDPWLKALDVENSFPREKATELIKKYGLDVESEIKRLSNFYNQIARSGGGDD